VNKFLTMLLALFIIIIISGTGCIDNNSALNQLNPSESPAVSKESMLPTDTFKINNVVTDDSEEVKSVKLKITIGEKSAIAVLDDSETARDFMSLLPLTLTMTDYNGIEKVADMPRKLNLDDAPTSFDPRVGDVCTYAPWGNFVVFYKAFGNTNGLVPLAHIESGLDYFAEQSGEFEITIDIED